MSNKVIQQSLINIEQNLRKLESARNQVEKISDRSSELITSISSVLKSINAIRQSFESDENYLINNVKESLKSFADKLDEGAASANKKTVEITAHHEKIIEGSISKIKDFLENLSDVQQSILDFDLKESLDKIRQELVTLTETIKINQSTNTQELNAIKSELEAARIRQEKAAGINLIVLVLGFVLTIVILLT